VNPDDWLRLLRTRLATRPRADAGRARVMQAFGGAGDASGGPAHWLAAGWAPQPDGLYRRLPEFAAIASPDRDRALAEVLVHVPAPATVWLAAPDTVDAALVAETVLAVDRNLQPWHRDGLRAFVAAQRAADLARIRARYTDREDGFERLRRTLLGDAADAPPAGQRD